MIYSLKLDLSQSSKESFFNWAWSDLSGLQGIDEGTVLSEEAAEQGLETESWTIDAAEAPHNRDWVGGLKVESIRMYFADRESAQLAQTQIQTRWKIDSVLSEDPEQDWDLEWKKSFQGIELEPHWFIRPPHRSLQEVQALYPGRKIMTINPGAGFGTGTHETTQLILNQLIQDAELKSRISRSGARVLDFGSGSGILSIGVALVDANVQVDAVEIDVLANENAVENARLNQVSDRIQITTQMSAVDAKTSGRYDLVIANILKPVLIEFAGELVKRMSPSGALMLSGLMEGDLPEVIAAYRAQGLSQAVILKRGDWRALKFIA